MRTTVDLADDVAAEVAKLRREKGLGLSEAVNELARAGFSASKAPYVYVHRSYDMGLKIDITSIADALELADEYDRAERSGHAS